jgi:hypothetical protein
VPISVTVSGTLGVIQRVRELHPAVAFMISMILFPGVASSAEKGSVPYTGGEISSHSAPFHT